MNKQKHNNSTKIWGWQKRGVWVERDPKQHGIYKEVENRPPIKAIRFGQLEKLFKRKKYMGINLGNIVFVKITQQVPSKQLHQANINFFPGWFCFANG